jgi:hypothetical protein
MLGVAILIVLLILQQQQWVHLPGSGRYESAFPDAVHGSWFACVTWVLLLFASRWTRGGATVAVVAPIGLCLAVGTELLQLVTGGDAELGDVFFDMVGMCAALFFWGARRGLVSSRIGVPLAAALLIGSLWPGVAAYRLEQYRDSIVPDLVRFDSPHVWYFVSGTSAMALAPAPEGWSVTGPVLKVTLAGDTYPGIHLDDPIADWSAYSLIEVDAFVEGSTPMPITISVRIDHAKVDHVYREFTCAPGPCRLQLPIADLFDRSVARVNAVVIHSRHDQRGRVFYLGRVVLRT